MVDTRTKERRRKIMQAVGTKDTGPELAIRRLLHRLGYRFRLHRKDLPGKPDVVFPSRHKVVLIHGCFWHGHDCPKGRLPKSRGEYWRPKIESNRERDIRVVSELDALGWEALTLWQCELHEMQGIERRLCEFLGTTKRNR